MSDALVRDQRLCRNFLCILHSLDQHELVGAGVLHASDLAGWVAFRDGPYRAYLSLDDSREAKCFALVQTRLSPAQRATTHGLEEPTMTTFQVQIAETQYFQMEVEAADRDAAKSEGLARFGQARTTDRWAVNTPLVEVTDAWVEQPAAEVQSA